MCVFVVISRIIILLKDIVLLREVYLGVLVWLTGVSAHHCHPLLVTCGDCLPLPNPNKPKKYPFRDLWMLHSCYSRCYCDNNEYCVSMDNKKPVVIFHSCIATLFVNWLAFANVSTCMCMHLYRRVPLCVSVYLFTSVCSSVSCSTRGICGLSV